MTLYLPDDVRANLSASTFGGRVSSDFDEANSENTPDRERLSQALNGGGPDMILKTSGGSVRIRRFED